MRCAVRFSDIPQSKSRALDSIGRAYARMGWYKKAIHVYVLSSAQQNIQIKQQTRKIRLFNSSDRIVLELNTLIVRKCIKPDVEKMAT